MYHLGHKDDIWWQCLLRFPFPGINSCSLFWGALAKYLEEHACLNLNLSDVYIMAKLILWIFGNYGHYFNHWLTIRMHTLTVTFQVLMLTCISYWGDTVFHSGIALSPFFTIPFGESLGTNLQVCTGTRVAPVACGLILHNWWVFFSSYSFIHMVFVVLWITFQNLLLCCSNDSCFHMWELFQLAPFGSLFPSTVALKVLSFISRSTVCFRITTFCFLNHS